MKFSIHIKRIGELVNKIWQEDYNKKELHNDVDVIAWAEETIKRFNNSLHPWESPREFN